jgi:hypothetical protein
MKSRYVVEASASRVIGNDDRNAAGIAIELSGIRTFIPLRSRNNAIS